MRRNQPRSPEQLNHDLINHVNKIRRRQELPELVVKIRKCLRCDKEFESFAHDNRMCLNCREKQLDIFTDENKCGY